MSKKNGSKFYTLHIHFVPHIFPFIYFFDTEEEEWDESKTKNIIVLPMCNYHVASLWACVQERKYLG